MPHTNRRGGPVSPPFKPADFVSITLTKEQQQVLKASEWSIEHQDNGLLAALSEGYKLTLRYDERGDCFAAWLIPAEKSPNSGMILAGRGSTPTKAIKQLLYIHYKLMDRVWGSEDRRSQMEIDD